VKTGRVKMRNQRNMAKLLKVLSIVTGVVSMITATVIFPFSAQAETKKLLKPIVAGLNAKEGDPTYMSIKLIPKIMKEKYGIEINMIIHPAMTMGTDWSALEAVQHGFIDIASNDPANYAVFTKVWDYVIPPYLFDSREMAHRYYKSKLFWDTAARMEKDMPIKVLPAVDAGGYRLLNNNKRELRTPDDVKGLRFRTVRSPIAADLIQAWGGSPTPIAWAECYTSLQQGVIDGLHVQPIWLYRFNFFEVLTNATQVKANYAIQIQVMNKNTWNSMPPNVQKAFMAAAQEAADIANKMDWDMELEYTKKLEEKGVKIYKPTEAEKKEWRKKGLTLRKKYPVDPAILQAIEKLR
jgi:TRAP-type C4-dicarboxylate transport system substrate-binding protein